MPSQSRNADAAASSFSFAELFAGIGGFRLALERLGGSCVFASEWDKHAVETYVENFGDRPAGDIRSIPATVIPDHDILTAGFPCQPFSIAGVTKHNALGRAHGFEDLTRGTLFFEVARILEERKPAAFILENVKNLLRHDRGRTFDIIIRTLREQVGYFIHYSVLDASQVVPQHRERVFIVGFREPAMFENPQLPDFKPALRDILEPRVPPKYTLSDAMWAFLRTYAAKHHAKGNGFGYGLADLDGKTRTLSARYYKDGSEILVPQTGKNPRRLTPRECARLMGFPDKFRIVCSDSQAYRQFGNSVVVPVVEAIVFQVLKSLSTPKGQAERARSTPVQIDLFGPPPYPYNNA